MQADRHHNEDVKKGGAAGQWTKLRAFQLPGTWLEFVPAIQDGLSLLGRSSQSFLAKQGEHKSSLCMDTDRHWSFDYCWEYKWVQCCKCHWRKWEAPSRGGLGCYLYPEASWDEIIILWLSDHPCALMCHLLTALRRLLMKAKHFLASLPMYFPSMSSRFPYGYMCFAMMLKDLRKGPYPHLISCFPYPK